MATTKKTPVNTKAAAAKKKADDKDSAELNIIYSGYDPLNGLVEATKKVVYQRRKNITIKCDSEDMVKKVFDDCINDTQTF